MKPEPFCATIPLRQATPIDEAPPRRIRRQREAWLLVLLSILLAAHVALWVLFGLLHHQVSALRAHVRQLPVPIHPSETISGETSPR